MVYCNGYFTSHSIIFYFLGNFVQSSHHKTPIQTLAGNKMLNAKQRCAEKQIRRS